MGNDYTMRGEYYIPHRSAINKRAILKWIEEDTYRNNTINLGHAVMILECALENVETKADLSDSELLDIKNIRGLIKGL